MDPIGATVDLEKVDEFSGQLFAIYTGAVLNCMIDIGHRTGLFTAAAVGPATSDELADRAGLTERYVREWLGAMATGGIVEYEPLDKTYRLPPERAAALTDGPLNLAPLAQLHTHLAKHVHQVARAFREGGGVPYAEYRPELTDVLDAVSRSVFDARLLRDYLAIVPGLAQRLRAGARVADVGCGTGHAMVLLAREFPASTFYGFDIDDGAIARAQAEARGATLDNVTFAACDAARLTVGESLDVVFVFDAIHDQVDPGGVLDRIHAALTPGGLLFMKEPWAADALEDNLANPMAARLYSISTLHCMTVSLAHGGAGIGTVFGEGVARTLLDTAGFVDINVAAAPGDPSAAVYTCRTPAA
jgi:SAM-dependent methyltransferase